MTYSGSWKSARHGAYAGDARPLRDPGRRDGDDDLHRHRLTWYGPVGPTRGKARVSIDGRYVKTVDLHRTGFTAHAASSEVAGRSAARTR